MALNKLHSTNVQLLDDLACIREDFFQAVAEGHETANEFACRFTQLAEQATTERIQDIIQVDGKSRLAAAHNAVTTIGFVATGLYEVMKCADDLTAQLHLDIDDLLENLSLCNDTSSKDPTGCPTESPTNSESSSTLRLSPRRRRSSSSSSTNLEMNDIGLPRYQFVSHRWLCDNLHNPYPSASTKHKIAEASGVNSKVIGEWFSQARRRIGWTALLKKRFGGNRQLCIDCARDILIDGSGCSFYSPEITQDFRRMKSKTERLYRDRFGRSDVVKEITDIRPAATVHSELRTGMKRRSSAIDDYHQESHELSEYKACSNVRPVKRVRESFQSDLPPLSRTTSFSESVSSRSSTTELLTPTIQPFALPGSDFDDAIGEWVSSVSAEAVEDHMPESLPSRKRSSTDSDSRGSGKRMKLNEPDAYWPRSLSESLLNSRYVEQELYDLCDQFNFQLPPTASIVSELGDEGPLQIDLFSYASWDASQHDHSCKLYDEYQLKPVVGNVVPPTTDTFPVCQDITATGFGHVTMDTDLWTKQYEMIARGHADADCLFPPTSVDNSLDLLSLSSQLGDKANLPADSHSSGIPVTLPSATTTNVVDEERLQKLTRINNLLAEAAQLQSEVFC